MVGRDILAASQRFRTRAACSDVFPLAPSTRMLRYDRSEHQPRNYLSRAEQWRLLRLVIALGLILLLIQEVRGPRAARVLGIFFGGAQEPGQAQRQDVPQPPAVALRDRSPEGSASPAIGGAAAVAGLAGIQDNAPFRKQEVEPWYALLGMLHRTEAQALRAGSAEDVMAVQLLEQPDAYRGRLVTIRGTARQATTPDPLSARPTAAGLARIVFFPELEVPSLAIRSGLTQAFLSDYHRIVVQQSGASVPIVVFTLGVPEGFPEGEALSEEITATGYFFKNWLFSADGGLGVGPVVLAKRIDWMPVRPASEAPQAANRSDVVFALVASLLIAALVVAWLMRRSGGAARGRSSRRDDPEVSGSLRTIEPK